MPTSSPRLLTPTFSKIALMWSRTVCGGDAQPPGDLLGRVAARELEHDLGLALGQAVALEQDRQQLAEPAPGGSSPRPSARPIERRRPRRCTSARSPRATRSGGLVGAGRRAPARRRSAGRSGRLRPRAPRASPRPPRSATRSRRAAVRITTARRALVGAAAASGSRSRGTPAAISLQRPRARAATSTGVNGPAAAVAREREVAPARRADPEDAAALVAVVQRPVEALRSARCATSSPAVVADSAADGVGGCGPAR